MKTNWKNKTHKLTHEQMADIQDLIEQQYILLQAPEVSVDSLKLNTEALAEAADIDLTDAMFQASTQPS